jgi:hypothetical protein
LIRGNIFSGSAFTVVTRRTLNVFALVEARTNMTTMANATAAAMTAMTSNMDGLRYLSMTDETTSATKGQ